MEPCVYILASKPKGILYIGVTSKLQSRLSRHRSKHNSGFTKKYAIYQLVYYEYFDSILDAIHREKQLKNWHRQWKINFIESLNPSWKDLTHEL